MDPLTRLTKDFEQYRHESFMRDDRLDKRMDRLVTMQEEQWRTVQVIVDGMDSLTDKTIQVVSAVNVVSERMQRIEANLEKVSVQLDNLAVRQNQTEASIEILTNTMNEWIKNHPNGRG
jgi:methyl-accepting chemotaxis protein